MEQQGAHHGNDHSQAIILYPAYMDATKTWKGGRRIPKDKGECHNCVKHLLHWKFLR